MTCSALKLDSVGISQKESTKYLPIAFLSMSPPMTETFPNLLAACFNAFNRPIFFEMLVAKIDTDLLVAVSFVLFLSYSIIFGITVSICCWGFQPMVSK